MTPSLQSVILALVAFVGTPVLLYVVHELRLLPRRLYEILQGTYCLAVAICFIAFGIVFFLETGGIFKLRYRTSSPTATLEVAYLADAPVFFFATCAVWLFTVSFLLIGAWEMFRRRENKPTEPQP